MHSIMQQKPQVILGIGNLALCPTALQGAVMW